MHLLAIVLLTMSFISVLNGDSWLEAGGHSILPPHRNDSNYDVLDDFVLESMLCVEQFA